jgi:hypothetical protein
MERTSWMYNLSRLGPSYISEVHRFIDVATKHAWRTKTKRIYCPCMDYKNVVVFYDTNQIISHLVYRGFVKDYTIWTKHGEGSSLPYTTGNPEDDRFQFVHETHQPLPQSKHVVPNVTDHGYFDNNGELHSTPPSGNNRGHRVFEIVRNINFDFGKKTKDGKIRKDAKPALGAIFKKKSIFFEYLPY